MFFKKDNLKNFINFIGKHMCGNLFSAIIGLQFLEKETPTQLFSSEFCEMFKNTLFTEHFRTTASGYRNNMPRGFKTKCEKNESNDILITYLYLASAFNTSIHQTTSACKNKAKPHQSIPNHKVKIITFFIWTWGTSENMLEVKHLVHLKVWG